MAFPLLTCLSHLPFLVGFNPWNVAQLILEHVSHCTVIKTRFTTLLLLLYRFNFIFFFCGENGYPIFEHVRWGWGHPIEMMDHSAPVVVHFFMTPLLQTDTLYRAVDLDQVFCYGQSMLALGAVWTYLSPAKALSRFHFQIKKLVRGLIDYDFCKFSNLDIRIIFIFFLSYIIFKILYKI